jgi:hypothetical protein
MKTTSTKHRIDTLNLGMAKVMHEVLLEATRVTLLLSFIAFITMNARCMH